MSKLFVQYAEVHKLVAKIARDIAVSAWEPDLIVAIASGGFIPARILKTYLKKDIYVVGLRRYFDNALSIPVPLKVQWIDEVERKLSGKKVLLVDEVDDTRITLAYCVNELAKNALAEIRVAVLHQKDKRKLAAYPACVTTVYEGASIPDVWIKYPWDALDIDIHAKGLE